jgi:hypothetical protein
MNNSDFYKLKYLKYKNKYISLKNENVLEQKGGLPPSGRYLFLIPAVYFSEEFYEIDGKLSFGNDEKGSRGIYRKIYSPIRENSIKHDKQNLSYEELCDMSLLIIPYAGDKVKISSTDEWYIPQIIKKDVVPLKWVSSKQQIDLNDINCLWLYCIARGFLFEEKLKIVEKLKEKVKKLQDEVKKLQEKKQDITKLQEDITKLEAYIKTQNIDDMEVLCLEFDINRMKFNTFKGDVKLSTFKDYKERIQKYLKATPPNALIEASAEANASWDKLGKLGKLSRTASEKVTQLEKEKNEHEKQGVEKDKENQALEEAKKALDEAKKAYNIASEEFSEKKALRTSLELSSKFTSENIDFLKRYKGKLGWFLEGVDIDKIESTTVQ